MSVVSQMLDLPQPVQRARAPQTGLHIGPKTIAKAKGIFAARGGTIDSLTLGRKMGYRNPSSGGNLGHRLVAKKLVEQLDHELIDGKWVGKWKWVAA